MWETIKDIFKPESIIEYGGLALLLFVVFAETGLFIGFFLPGDSLMFLSGLLCRSKPFLLHDIPLVPLLICLISSAVLGNIAGYWFGYKAGPAIFKREDTLLFKKSYVELTKVFYDKHGGKALILGRFLPIIRTFAPILAGVIKVDLRIFMLYNIIGAAGWVVSLGLCGYFLGQYEWVQNNIGSIVIGLIIVTLIPLATSWFKRKMR